MSSQQDIRITKTRKALADTLIRLLSEKKFQKITVNDICQEAMVSRSTFYLHFEDKYQLLEFCIQMEHEYLREKAKNSDLREFLRGMLNGVKEHESIFRNLRSADTSLELIRMFHNLSHVFFVDFLKETEKRGVEHVGPLPLLAVYYSNGLSGMMGWWIENNFHYPIEEMVQCQYNLISGILPGLLPD